MFVVLALLAVFLHGSTAEMMLRGQCSSLIQPEENGINVDMDDFGFTLHIIWEKIKPVNTTDECMSNCLAQRDPKCRSAIFDSKNRRCIPLRINKQEALNFDRFNLTKSSVYGVLISPQEISYGVTDRSNGVKNCDSFCPSPQQISADTVDPVCVTDCPGTAYCAGEEAGCITYPRSLEYVREFNRWEYTHGGYDWHIKTYTFQKKHDFTHLRIFMSIPWSSRYYHTTRYDWYNSGYIFLRINGYDCNARNGHRQHMGRDVREGFNNGDNPYEWIESIQAEFVCQLYDTKAGPTEIRFYMSRAWDWNSHFILGPYWQTSYQPYFYFQYEEIIPQDWMMKMDDSVRCQSLTVFNTDVAPSCCGYWGNSFGNSPYAVWKYKKQSDTSTLRIMWEGYIAYQFQRACLGFEIWINDAKCQDPFPIEAGVFHASEGSGWDMSDVGGRFIQIDGICRNLPAGLYDIRLRIESYCKNDASASRSYHDVGHGRLNQFITEEIHENLPISSLLMDDGTLVQLPNFNRQYKSFDGYSYCYLYSYSTCFAEVPHQMVYKKLNDNSYLHVKWFGNIEASMWTTNRHQSLKWYITINDQQCSNPGPIEIWHGRKGAGYGLHFSFPKTIDGICKMNLPAGDYTIKVRFGHADPSYPMVDVGHPKGYGRISYSYIMAEEINPNI